MTAENQRSQRPDRLHRLEVVYARSPIYFVTTCTIDRRHILATAVIHESFVRFAEEGPKHGAWIGAYVLMPDHLHAFVAMDDEKISLAQWMKSLKNVLSKALRSGGVPAPHWQKTFFDRVFRSAESYSEKWNYVRENPVRAGLVQRWQDWPFAGEIFHWNIRATDRTGGHRPPLQHYLAALVWLCTIRQPSLVLRKIRVKRPCG